MNAGDPHKRRIKLKIQHWLVLILIGFLALSPALDLGERVFEDLVAISNGVDPEVGGKHAEQDCGPTISCTTVAITLPGIWQIIEPRVKPGLIAQGRTLELAHPSPEPPVPIALA